MTLQIYPFSASESKIDGLRIINVKMVTDDRGTVRELYRESSHSEVLPETLSSWKQINLTRTKRGAVRGLHGEAMAKLVTVATGSVFGVYVDTRPDSRNSTYYTWNTGFCSTGRVQRISGVGRRNRVFIFL